jgi:hypothetical protein
LPHGSRMNASRAVSTFRLTPSSKSGARRRSPSPISVRGCSRTSTAPCASTQQN